MGEDVHERLERLAGMDSKAASADKETQRVWLLLGLLWLERNEELVDDPLSFAEDCADDVDWPDETPRWFRHNPPGDEWDPMQHTKVENVAHLNGIWKAYLREHAPRYLEGQSSFDSGASHLRSG